MSGLTRSTYLVTMVIGQMLMLAGAVAIPVWVTPGYYWWSALLLILVLMDGAMIGKRMNLWEGKP